MMVFDDSELSTKSDNSSSLVIDRCHRVNRELKLDSHPSPFGMNENGEFREIDSQLVAQNKRLPQVIRV